MDKTKQKIIISTGNLGVGGQERMLIEFLKFFSPKDYQILLLIEEDKGEENHYIGEIPSHVEYRFLTSEKFMEELEREKLGKSLISKLKYSNLLQKKKKLAINEVKKHLDFADTIIDYNMGLLRYLHKLNLKEKRVIGWSHAGEGSLERKKQKRLNMGLYDTVVAINSKMKEGYEKNYSHEKFNVVKIYNFIEESLVREKADAFQVEEKTPYILIAGALVQNKNHELLIKAFKKVADQIENINLLILGRGPLREELESLVKNLGLGERVKFKGLQQNPFPYIKKSKFFIQSSVQEGMPLVIMESMILGKAVISTRNNGSIEIMEDGKYGVLAEHNPEDLGEKIIDLLQNPEKLEKFQKLSLERSMEFSKERVGEAIEKLIRGFQQLKQTSKFQK
ncbi:MAG: glycosyltransferase [Fusobacteriaceae bacterium]